MNNSPISCYLYVLYVLFKDKQKQLKQNSKYSSTVTSSARSPIKTGLRGLFFIFPYIFPYTFADDSISSSESYHFSKFPIHAKNASAEIFSFRRVSY